MRTKILLWVRERELSSAVHGSENQSNPAEWNEKHTAVFWGEAQMKSFFTWQFGDIYRQSLIF